MTSCVWQPDGLRGSHPAEGYLKEKQDRFVKWKRFAPQRGLINGSVFLLGLQLIEPWFLECEGSRERALQASFQVLAPFQASFHLQDGENFKGYGFAVSFLAPYILENSIACRQWAAKCIGCLIHIQGGSRITEAEEKEMTSALCDLQAEVPTDLSGAWARLAKVVSIHLAKDQLLDFTEAILEDLVSGIPSYARAGGYWLLANLQNHGEAMKSKAGPFIWTKGSWDDLSGHVQTWAQLYKPRGLSPQPGGGSGKGAPLWS
uniref:Maestro heat-like repeat-containing protein family member 2B n=1 Tax=Pogona vitticeps TaxID=103695 RepID=A0ABM5EY70_9SAUR